MKPLFGQVVVKFVEKQNTTTSGIVLPGIAEDTNTTEGIVLAVGTGSLTANGETVPMQVQINDHVLFPKFAGTELTLKGKKIIFVDQKDILGIL